MSQVLRAVAVTDSAEARRRLIFGALMLYSAESIPLRERALEAAVLAALVGSTAGNPLRNGDVQRNLRAGIGNIDVRPEVIRNTLEQLAASGLVGKGALRQKDVYYLTESGNARTGAGASESRNLFEPVLSEILEHAGDDIDKTQATTVLEEFICTAFARFGASIAGFLAGRRPQFANSLELSVTFDEIAAKNLVPSESLESLKARCMRIFRSRSASTSRLMLHLTQGYCFAQLLGADHVDFNPIAEEAFRASVFYCDTNVLIAGLLPGSRGQAFAEILAIARRVGAELRVTRATVDETRHTAGNRLATLERIANTVPTEVGVLSSDEFVEHFYELRKENPQLTPAEFLAPFDSIADIARDRWGLVVEEVLEESLLEDADTAGIAEAIQAAALASRGWKKSAPVLHHDVAHLELVRQTRYKNPKTWFLTRDGTLLGAATEIAHNGNPDARPLCFAMLGFLQSISPFVSNPGEESALADFFSGLLREQLFVTEKLFDDRELALIVETHADVMAMPPEQVVLAVDYVKKHILRGEPYKREMVPVVALELRKFISANVEEREAALRALAEEHRDKYQATRLVMMKERALREEYEGRLQKAEDDRDQARSTASARGEEVEEVRRSSLAREARLRVAIWTGLCVIAGIVVGQLAPAIINWVATKDWSHHHWASHVASIGFRLVAFGLLLLPLMRIIPRRFKRDFRTAIKASLIIAWLWLSGVQSSKAVGELADLAGLALFGVLFLTERDPNT